MDPVTTLLELQEHDLAIVRLSKELDEMPEKRAILAARAKLADIAKLKERSETVMRHFEAAAKLLEDQIATVTVKMEGEQARLVSGEITNPKELQSVAREMDSLRRRVEQLEAEELKEMQKREDGAAQVAKIDAALTEGARREAALTDQFKARGGEILGRIDAEKKARAALFAALPADLGARYETQREEHHGSAVGEFNGVMCSGCRVGLPSAKVQALLAGPELTTCPNCQRILIVRGA